MLFICPFVSLCVCLSVASSLVTQEWKGQVYMINTYIFLAFSIKKTFCILPLLIMSCFVHISCFFGISALLQMNVFIFHGCAVQLCFIADILAELTTYKFVVFFCSCYLLLPLCVLSVMMSMVLLSMQVVFLASMLLP